MAYVTILKKTESQLRLLREPTFLSKAIFFGFLVGVSGVLLFGSESILFKVLIGFGAIILSSFMVDNYELCDINKDTSELRLTRLHLCQYYLGSSFMSQPYVTSKLSDVEDVKVEENASEKSCRVVFVLKSGIQLGVTEVFTNNALSEHEKIAETISSFLGAKKSAMVEDDAEYEGDGSSSSEDDADEDDDFEQISKSDIEKLEEEQNNANLSTDSVEQTADTDNGSQPSEEINSGELPHGDGSEIKGN